MSEQPLNLAALAASAGWNALATQDPPTTLWSRIDVAHAKRRRQRRWKTIVATSFVTIVAVGTMGLIARQYTASPSAGIDWQARAQALELQLHQLDASMAHAPGNAFVVDTQAALSRVDRALQEAYDADAPVTTLAPLWRQRSELLDALIVTRAQQVTMTRI